MQPYNSSNNNLSRKYSFYKNITKALQKESWHWSALNLAWTAGPVTYLALQGGSYLGYGKMAQPEIFIYFAGYTIIAGLCAVIVQFIKHIIVTPRIENDKKRLHSMVDQLFMLIFAARNAYLSYYSEDEQKIMAAWWSCRSGSTDMDIMEETIRDISENDALAQSIKRIEFYRKQGYVDLMQKEYKQSEESIKNLYNNLCPQYPVFAELINKRFKGNPPKASEGQPRIVGFIERISIADQEGNLAFATIDDAMAMFVLTLEFLLGREIITLHPQFNGHPKLENSRQKFESLLSDFRLLLRKRNSAMRALIEDIYDDPKISDSMYNISTKSILLQNKLLHALGNEKYNLKTKESYSDIIKINKKLHLLWKKLNAHEILYNKLWDKQADKLRKEFANNDMFQKKKSVLTIIETELLMTEKQKNILTKKIEILLNKIHVKKHSLIGIDREEKISQMDINAYKKLAADLLNILDEMLNITEPEEQLAIETSREADFGYIEPGMTAKTKAFWGYMMVEEIQQDRIHLSHQFASFLTRYLNVPLGKSIINYLVDKYGASREFLEKMHVSQSKKIAVGTESMREDLLDFPTWEKIQKKS